MKTIISGLNLLRAVALAVAATGAADAAPPSNPVLYMVGMENYTVSGQHFVRYRYDIFNKASYPADMFAPAPALPPCGLNHNSARTWVDIYDQNGKRLNGFCALGSPNDLGGIWFSLSDDVLPPSWIYVELNDRQANIKYKSNLAETTM